MARAHICTDCGYDMARERPAWDSRLRLPLVTCPNCGRAAVRERHPLEAWWRKTRRLIWSLGVLLVQLGLLILFTTLTLVGVALAQDFPHSTLNEEDWIAFFFFGFIVPLGLGAWFTAGLAHWPRWRPWLVWPAWIGGVWLVGGVISLVDRWLIAARFDNDASGPISFGGGDDLVRVFEGWLATLLLVLAFQLLIAAAGIPLGWMARWMGRLVRRGVMHRRRAAWRAVGQS